MADRREMTVSTYDILLRLGLVHLFEYDLKTSMGITRTHGWNKR